jgi:3-methylcrotonyl-CoA carboxylase alpha subunit
LIHSLLIANRGEIVCRIIRSGRRLGIRRVAVFSDADAKALHVREADQAVHIGPSPARDVLGLAFSTCLNAPIPKRARFGVFRM